MRGYACVLVLGGLSAIILHGAELVEADSEPQETRLEGEKIKRGAVKITDPDNPSFNHLTSDRKGGSSGSTSTSGSSSSGNVGFKQYSVIPPFRYIPSDRYQTLLPSSYPSRPAGLGAAAGVGATHYPFYSPVPVEHYLQSPTQIHYVSTPAVKQLPILRVSDLMGQSSASNTVSAHPSALFVPPVHMFRSHEASTSVPRFSPPADSQSTKIFRVSPELSTPLYYHHQHLLVPFLMPQAATMPHFFYHQPGPDRFPMPHHYITGFRSGNALGLYPATQADQLTYFYPMGGNQIPHGTNSGKKIKSSSDKHPKSNHSNSLTRGSKHR